MENSVNSSRNKHEVIARPRWKKPSENPQKSAAEKATATKKPDSKTKKINKEAVNNNGEVAALSPIPLTLGSQSTRAEVEKSLDYLLGAPFDYILAQRVGKNHKSENTLLLCHRMP